MAPRRTAAGVAAGFVGAVLVSVASQALSYTAFGQTRADSTFVIRTAGRALGLVGLVGLLVGWRWVRELAHRHVWLVLGLWSLPLLFTAPVGSKDAYAYAEQGWLVGQGYDPYTTPMSSVGGPFAHLVDSYWQNTTTVYPPLALEAQRFVVWLTSADPYWSVVGMRLPALVGLALAGVFVPMLASQYGLDPKLAAWAVLLNPLSILHVVGGAHNDALAAGLGITAIWLAARFRNWGWLVACVVTGLAMAVKQPLGLVAVASAALGLGLAGAMTLGRWLVLGLRATAGVVITVATFAAVSLASGLGFGWATSSGTPYAVGTIAPLGLLAGAWRLTGGTMAGALTVLSPIGMAVAAGLMAWWAKRWLPTEPVRWLAWSLLAFVVLAPALQTWYVLWGGLFLPAFWKPSDRGRRVVVAVLIFSLVALWALEWTKVLLPWGTLAAVAVAATAWLGRPWRLWGVGDAVPNQASADRR